MSRLIYNVVNRLNRVLSTSHSASVAALIHHGALFFLLLDLTHNKYYILHHSVTLLKCHIQKHLCYCIRISYLTPGIIHY